VIGGAWRSRWEPGVCSVDVSPVPLGSKGAHDPRVKWPVATVKHGAEAQPAPRKPKKMT